jgi:hypothetical protein
MIVSNSLFESVSRNFPLKESFVIQSISSFEGVPFLNGFQTRLFQTRFAEKPRLTKKIQPTWQSGKESVWQWSIYIYSYIGSYSEIFQKDNIYKMKQHLGRCQVKKIMVILVILVILVIMVSWSFQQSFSLQDITIYHLTSSTAHRLQFYSSSSPILQLRSSHF